RSFASLALQRLPRRRRLAADVDQVPRERHPVPVRMERLVTVPKQDRDPLQVVDERELARRVVPLAGVVAIGPCSEGRQRLDLDLVLPPPRSDRQAVALAQSAYVGPEPLEPHPAL